MSKDHQWTFFTNHGHVLVSLAWNPRQPLREVALQVGITERAVQRIVADLETAGYLSRKRHGRQNHYRIHTHLPMRHPLESPHTVGELLSLVIPGEGDTPT